jgi:hypothetical protein
MISKNLLESILNEAHLGEAVEVKGKDMYEFTHGRKPRGSGNWMFGIGPKSNHEKDGQLDFSQVHQHNGSYGDAVSSAKARARQLGHTEVHVLS